MILYMKTDLDEYELPIAVATSTIELAQMLKTTPGVVSSSISHGRRGWYRLEVPDKEDG